MADLAREVSMTLDHDDVAAILTESLCRYGPLDGLRVEYVVGDGSNAFVVTMTPKPKETE